MIQRRERASVMIFMVVIMAAMTTVVVSTLDLSAVIEKRQHQMEREAAWHYIEESAITRVNDNINERNDWDSDFWLNFNGINARVQSRLHPTWEVGRAVQINISGNLEGKTRTVDVTRSGRAEPNPFTFALFSLDSLDLTSNISVNGDAYIERNFNPQDFSFSVSKDVYSASDDSDLEEVAEGEFFANQREFDIAINLDQYRDQANRVFSNSVSMSNPLFMSSLTKSELIYVNGNLTISGSYLGNATIVVNGNVRLVNPRATSFLDHLVILCVGNIEFSPGVHDVFAACQGNLTTSGSSSSSRTINGSLVFTSLSLGDARLTVNHDNLFSLNPSLLKYFQLPTQW